MTSGTGRAAGAESPGRVVIAGRYELSELIGTGGAGRVHAARDAVTGARVAVKLLDAGPANTSLRVHREISALRLLRLPGVVGLLDEGTHDGSRFLVMDLVEGRPFPGTPTPASWDAIAPLALALLEILARVHAAGVVHRDLKPSNVLVDGAGSVTVLDFGISWGPALGEALTAVGTVVGTPAYLAPEQFVGASGDARTDLYALGVMLYESLAGRPPHEATDFNELVSLKRSQMPVPLRIVAPAVPRDVAGVIDQLLAMDPEDRPQSAGEALQSFFGRRPAGAMSRVLPRLGGDAPVERLVEAALAGRSTDVAGPRGSGRTRVLTEAADRLAALGRTVHWLVPAGVPYASLASLLGGLDQLRDASPQQAAAEILARVGARLRDGVVVVADDVARMDRWSADALHSCRAEGAVLRVTESPEGDAVRLAELTETDLRELFAGPDRIFHFREDGARELWRRTGGLPSRIATEIAAWVRAGLAHWDGDRVVIRRDALHRLRGGQAVGDELLLRPGGASAGSPHLDDLLAWIAFAWPHATVELLAKATAQPRWRVEPAIDALAEQQMIRRLPDGSVQPLVVPRSLHSWPPERRRAAHKALSIALPPGTPLRLRHLAAAGEPEEVADEALLLAPELTRQGRTGDALVVLEEGLSAARRTGDRDRETGVLVEFAKTCLAEATPNAADRALYELSRAANREAAPIPQIERLLRGARAAMAGDPEQALRVLTEAGPIADVELELRRHANRVLASRRLPLQRQAAVLDETEAWARTSGHPRALASVASWRGLYLTQQRRWAEAAELHQAAAEHTDRVQGRMASLFNAGCAFVECGRMEDARTAAVKCRELAASCHYARYEAWAEHLLRLIAYRLGEASAADTELIDAVSVVGEPLLRNFIVGTEAAIAWRAGALAVARDLAAQWRQSSRALGENDVAALARALELACGAAPEDGEMDRLLAEAAAFPDPTTAVQTLGMLAIAVPRRAAQARAAAARRAADLGDEDRSRRGPVITIDEALRGAADAPKS